MNLGPGTRLRPSGRFVLIKRKVLSGTPRELIALDGWSATDPSVKKAQ